MAPTNANRRAGDAAARQAIRWDEEPAENSHFPDRKQDRDIVTAVARSRSRTGMADALRRALKNEGARRRINPAPRAAP